MPDHTKIRWSQLRVGVIAITAFAILFVMVFLLTSSKGGLFQHNALLRTYMEDASGLSDGTAVGTALSECRPPVGEDVE